MINRREAEETIFHRVVVDGAADLHSVVSADGVCLFLAESGLRRFGWSPDEVVGSPARDLVHPDDADLVLSALAEATTNPGTAVTTIARFRCGDGSYRWTETVSSVPSWSTSLIVSTTRDIAARHHTEADLRRRATTDPLTGVANRTVFMDRVQHALRRLERQETLVAVFMLDLDGFKRVNDTLGHSVGDVVLSRTAERIGSMLRHPDTLARLGGDEFAILIEDVPHLEMATALADRIVAASREPITIGDEDLVCTTSLGISVTGDSRRSPETLLEEADLALYRAKETGRDRKEVYDFAFRDRAVDRQEVERMLRRAMSEDRLRAVYQPIIDLRSGRTVAAEALVRVWESDGRELVTAGSFIEVAEDSGLLADIDTWMLGQTVDQIATWRSAQSSPGLDDVALNITARHLADAQFSREILETLAACDVPATMLHLEVTEQVLIDASKSTLAALDSLMKEGVKVGLDDFGTGCSSLSNLRDFPLDFVKVDRSLVRDVHVDGPERAMVGAIIDFSHALDLAVVAEGVETPEQLEQLVALGCDRVQGFHFAAAGPAADIGRPWTSSVG